MVISFSPQYGPGNLNVSRNGDSITINGDTVDFSELPEGAEITYAHGVHPWLSDTVRRVDGKVMLTLRLPYLHDGHVDTPPSVIDPPNGDLPIPSI